MKSSSQGQDITSPLLSILISVFLFMMAVGLLNIFLSVRMSLAAVNSQVIGIIMASYFGGMIAGCLQARRVIGRVGHIRSFTAFAATATISVILHGLFESLTVWALLRVLTGFSLAGMYMVVESWLQEIAPRGNRGHLFSLYMLSNYTGMAAGQMLLTAGDPVTMQLILVIALLFALCLVPIALTHAHHPAQIEVHNIEFLNFMRKIPLGALGAFNSGMIVGAYLSLAPAWAIQAGMETDRLSTMMAISVIGGLLLQWPIGKLSDRYDRGKLMIALGLIIAIVPLGFVYNLNIPVLLLTSAAVFGGLAYSVYPMSVCVANDETEEGQFVTTATVLLILYGIGATLGPLTAAFFMWLLGPFGLFLFISVTALIFSGFAWRWYDQAPDLHQTAFIPVPRTTILATEMDPRAEAETGQAP